MNRAWQAFLRRFDIEHTFRFLKQQLGWTRPKLRDPAAADRWTWLVIAAYAQLHLARDLAADIRLPWQQPCAPGRLTPSRVRRGVSPHPPGPARSRQRAETLPARPRPPGRIEEPAARHPPRRRQNRQARGTEEENPQAGRLNNKLSSTSLSDLCSNLKWQAAARDLLAALKTDSPRKVHQLSTPET